MPSSKAPTPSSAPTSCRALGICPKQPHTRADKKRNASLVLLKKAYIDPESRFSARTHARGGAQCTGRFSARRGGSMHEVQCTVLICERYMKEVWNGVKLSPVAQPITPSPPSPTCSTDDDVEDSMDMPSPPCGNDDVSWPTPANHPLGKCTTPANHPLGKCTTPANHPLGKCPTRYMAYFRT